MADGIEKTSIAWHPAFCGAAQFDLRAESSVLEFEPEHNLSKEPLRIDLLIIRKTSDVEIENDIARIFRKVNVIEYKSPADGLTIDDLYKTIGYACIYKGTTKHVNEVPSSEMTVSVFREAYPSELMNELAKDGANVRQAAPGIYYVEEHFRFPVQIVVMRELDSAKHSGLRILSRKAQYDDVRTFIAEAAKATSSGDRQNVDAVLQASISANAGLYELIRKENGMCQALEELMKDRITEKYREGMREGVVKGMREGMREGKRETVKNLRLMGMDIPTIAKAVNVPEVNVLTWLGLTND